MEYVQFKNGSPVYYKEQPDLNECIQYQVSITNSASKNVKRQNSNTEEASSKKS